MAAASITPKQYIGWVQRSLNRLLGCSLVTDGSDTEQYRDQVKDFKFAYALGGSPQIGVAEQNALIKANHLTPEYVAWAQEALNAVGASMGAPITGTADAGTKTSILSFQSYEGLGDDGWIGAQTETRLIARSGLLPPGHLTAGTPPKKPKPPVKPTPVDPLPPEQRMQRVVNAIIYEIQFNPKTYPNVQQRKRVACLMLKIKKKLKGEWIGGKRVDDSYIPKGGADYPRQYALGMGPLSYSGGAIVEDLELSAAATLRKGIMRLPPNKRTEQDAIRKVALNLDYDIEAALNSISNVYNVHGENNMGAKLLNKWGMDKQARPESILSCYK